MQPRKNLVALHSPLVTPQQSRLGIDCVQRIPPLTHHTWPAHSAPPPLLPLLDVVCSRPWSQSPVRSLPWCLRLPIHCSPLAARACRSLPIGQRQKIAHHLETVLEERCCLLSQSDRCWSVGPRGSASVDELARLVRLGRAVPEAERLKPNLKSTSSRRLLVLWTCLAVAAGHKS